MKAHQTLLGKFSQNYICIIEDMMLAHIDKGHLKRVIAIPLRVKGVDSGQVSVLAVFPGLSKRRKSHKDKVSVTPGLRTIGKSSVS
ncbi:MAG: hypothetical protein Q4D19_07450 [Lautropia sp.]|nr:hypothetical protein [Lautropia sp.]